MSLQDNLSSLPKSQNKTYLKLNQYSYLKTRYIRVPERQKTQALNLNTFQSFL
ncbi:hypothetical protein BY996DRAFT_6530387 [Phakopsora pachyrhizi]|nr:hypothetical protein BY996DRAFT_6530387 [Phakopsora pachyrhizi]